MEGRYGFGENWQKFLKTDFSEERAAIAQAWLLNFLGLERLDGLSFLDIGSGSGLHSLGAWRAGARQVVSFDYDPNSVAATRFLHDRAGKPENWAVFQGSILDRDLCARLDKADIVYSWGVLHHTGDVWAAIDNTISLMGADSRLYIALYDEDRYFAAQEWLDIKQRYNRAGRLRRWLMEMEQVWTVHCHRKPVNLLRLPAIARAYRASRGMALLADVRDWLGGWPMEFTNPRQVVAFAQARGLALVKLSVGEGNAEYLFAPAEALERLGLTAMDLPLSVRLGPLRDLGALAGLDQVHIFGAGQGGRLLLQALRREGGPKVAGFIDPQDSGTLEGLPVVPFDAFAASHDRDTAVLLSNRYEVANAERLAAQGFTRIYPAHQLVMELARREA